jgi:hypothetical protein
MPIDINNDTATENSKDEARLESRVRSSARRLGLAVRKCRSRNPQVPSYGCYRIMDLFRNCIMAGGQPHDYSLSLHQVEA